MTGWSQRTTGLVVLLVTLQWPTVVGAADFGLRYVDHTSMEIVVATSAR